MQNFKPSMKQHELTFSIIKIPLDFLVIYFSFFIAKEIRISSELIPLPLQTIDNGYLHGFALIWAMLYILLFASHKLYNLKITHSKIQEILDIMRYAIYWFLFFSVGVYLWNWIIYSGAEIPRLIIVFTAILWITWSVFTRILLNILHTYLLQKWKIPKRNLLLISNKSIGSISELLLDIGSSKIYNIIGYSNNQKNSDYTMKYIWGIDQTLTYISQYTCDEILYVDSDFSKKDLYNIWEHSRIYWIRYRYVTNNFDVTKTNTSLSLINRTPVIEIENTPLDNWGRVGKRIFDMFISISILILFLPIWLIIGLLIKIDDPKAPIIYKNRRIGQNWKIFNCYKFRYLQWKYCIKESYGTTNIDDPAINYEKQLIKKWSSRTWPLYKISQDPRKTKIWTFLEKRSLDEIPQLLNIIKWEMSLVWPRPHQPREVEKYEQYQQRLLTVKPGLTGMAQVNGREKNNFALEAKLDIFYIENWSFLLDFKILLKTFVIILTRK